MSEISAEEKKRILRERRQAKLAHGNASSRLNQILNNGSVPQSPAEKTHQGVPNTGETENGQSGPTKIPQIGTGIPQIGNEAGNAPNSAISPEPVAMSTATDIGMNSAPETVRPVQPEQDQKVNLSATNLGSNSSNNSDHDDPEGPDISSVSHPIRVSDPEELDMDTLLKQIFSGSNGQNGTQAETGDFFANMMKAVGENADIPGDPAYNAPQSNMVAYQQYQQKQLDARFTMIRLMTHVSIFAYHYYTQPSFRSSAYAYIRTQTTMSCTYSRSFVSAEIAFVSAYYYLMSSKGLLSVASSNNLISKLLSMASAVFPPANAYQPLVNTLLVYWGGASIVISDLSLVVLMFGLVSIFS